MKARSLLVPTALLAGFVSLGNLCSPSVYSNECQELSDRITTQVDDLAAAHQDCTDETDCTFVTVVLPCYRDNARVIPLARAEYEVFRSEIQTLSSTLCTEKNTDDCNAHCGSPSGSLIFSIIETTCTGERCTAVQEPEGLATPEEGGSLSSQELCSPSKFVYLPEDI